MKYPVIETNYSIDSECFIVSGNAAKFMNIIEKCITLHSHIMGTSDTLPVREITKSSSTFSATNISSNMIWFFQMHDTIKSYRNQL